MLSSTLNPDPHRHLLLTSTQTISILLLSDRLAGFWLLAGANLCESSIALVLAPAELALKVGEEQGRVSARVRGKHFLWKYNTYLLSLCPGLLPEMCGLTGPREAEDGGVLSNASSRPVRKEGIGPSLRN